jgi:hypothetical protein
VIKAKYKQRLIISIFDINLGKNIDTMGYATGNKKIKKSCFVLFKEVILQNKFIGKITTKNKATVWQIVNSIL